MKTFSLARNGQAGAALIVVLLLLLIVTLLGLAAMRGALLQERMAGATYQRGLTFQAAESGLKAGETSVVATRPAVPAAAGTCSAGVCSMFAPGVSPSWKNDSFWTSANTIAGPSINGVSTAYVIEAYGQSENSNQSLDPGQRSGGTTAEVYRVVSRAIAPSGAQVTLQSIYRVKR